MHALQKGKFIIRVKIMFNFEEDNKKHNELVAEFAKRVSDPEMVKFLELFGRIKRDCYSDKQGNHFKADLTQNVLLALMSTFDASDESIARINEHIRTFLKSQGDEAALIVADFIYDSYVFRREKIPKEILSTIMDGIEPSNNERINWAVISRLKDIFDYHHSAGEYPENFGREFDLEIYGKLELFWAAEKELNAKKRNDQQAEQASPSDLS